jgi:hypothetical protein
MPTKSKTASKKPAKTATQKSIKPAVTPKDADKIPPEKLTGETNAKSAATKETESKTSSTNPVAENTDNSAKTSDAPAEQNPENSPAKPADEAQADQQGDEQTSEQSNTLDASKDKVEENPARIDPSPKKGEKPRKPLKKETAAQKEKVSVNIPKPDRKVQNSIAKQAKKEDQAEVERLEGETDRIVRELVSEIRSTMPSAMIDLDEKEFETVVREEVEKVFTPRVEDRSTEPMIISRIKTDVKTRIADAVKQSKNKAGGVRLHQAQIDVATSSKSPMPLSPESLMEVAESVPDFDTPEHRKAVEKEQKRISALSTGEIDKSSEMIPERTYQFQKKQSEKERLENPTARRESFVGRLAEAPTFGKATVGIIADGKETGRTSKVTLKDYDIREVSRNEAHDLSRAAL